MIHKMIVVMLTGIINGNTILKNDGLALAPSIVAASMTSFGTACKPDSRRIIINGINIQPSTTSIQMRASHGEEKKAGVSHPRKRAKVVAGPKRYSKDGWLTTDIGTLF
jgi:hypothetical protein